MLARCFTITTYLIIICSKCGQLFAVNGLWKLSYPVCLFKVHIYVEGIKVNLPDCFTMNHSMVNCFVNIMLKTIGKLVVQMTFWDLLEE